MNKFIESVKANTLFAVQFLLIVIAIFVVALALEKLADRKNGVKERALTTQKMTMTAMFSAIALILHLLDFPLPFLAPDFYKLDFSELPALVGAFAFGPVVGVLIEAVKILLKLMIKGTSTAFVGDLANFVIGCSFSAACRGLCIFCQESLSCKKNLIFAENRKRPGPIRMICRRVSNTRLFPCSSSIQTVLLVPDSHRFSHSVTTTGRGLICFHISPPVGNCTQP